MASSTQLSWKWLAGFFDGEGCISICPQNAGYPAMVVRLSLSQSGEQAFILNEIKAWLEDQFCSVYIGPSHHGSFNLQIGEFDSVEYILKKLHPHLLVKKDRATECLKYIKEVRKLKTRYGHFWSKHVTWAPARLRVT